MKIDRTPAASPTSHMHDQEHAHCCAHGHHATHAHAGGEGGCKEHDALDISRRRFLGASAAGLAAGTLAGPGLAGTALASDFRRGLPAGRRILLKGGVVLSMDDAIGSLERGDVLIDGETIAEVGRNIDAQAQIIDAAGMIVMPGFVDTHHHQYETIQRAIIADGILRGDWPLQTYWSVVQAIWTNGRNDHFDLGRSPYDPEDNYISELVASLSQISAGVTTGIDTSQSSHSPAHTEAMIAGLMDSGRRSVYAYSPGRGDAKDYEYPGALGDTSKGLGRLKKQFFSSGDQLVTLALGSPLMVERLRLARDFAVPLVSHTFAEPGAKAIDAVAAAGLLGPDQVYIHCTQYADDTFKKIADSGGHVSIATTIEMQMRHGMPPMQQALAHGILPSLSTDVETNMSADMFSVMRATFTLQRALLNERYIAGEKDLPQLVSCDQVLRMATVAGARACGLEKKIGTLTPGKQADIIMLDARRINTMPLNNAAGSVVTMMDTSNVRNVFIAGRLAKWNYELVGVDVEKLHREIEASRDRVLARIRAGFPAYAPSLVASCCLPYGSG